MLACATAYLTRRVGVGALIAARLITYATQFHDIAPGIKVLLLSDQAEAEKHYEIFLKAAGAFYQ